MANGTYPWRNPEQYIKNQGASATTVVKCTYSDLHGMLVMTQPNTNNGTSFSAVSISATTFYSGTTNLNYLLGGGSGTPTYVQAGSNITTGGTASAPTVNLASSPSVNNLIASGVSYGATVSGNSIYIGSDLQANIRSVRLTGNISSSSSTFTNITGLSFDIEANTTYMFEFVILFTSPATGTGAGFSLNGPSSPTTFGGRVESHQAAGNIVSFMTAYDVGSIASGVASAGATYTAVIQGVIVNGANAGTLIARMARGGTANNITVKAGSCGILTKTS